MVIYGEVGYELFRQINVNKLTPAVPFLLVVKAIVQTTVFFPREEKIFSPRVSRLFYRQTTLTQEGSLLVKC